MEFQQTNILSMTGNDDFATISDLSNYVDLTTNQTIGSGAIKTFTTLPQSSAVPTTGPQLVNKTYVDTTLGGFVTLATNQTITGQKVFNANVRLNNTRQLIFGTLSPANINYSIPNLYYDITGGGHYFFIGGSPNLYIDTDGLNIESGKRIYFNGKRCSVRDNGTQLEYNVPTNNSHSLRINGVEHLKVQEDIYGTFWKMPNSMIREQTIYPALVFQVPDTYAVRTTINNQDALKVEYDNTNGSIWTFSAGSVIREYLSFNWLLFQIPFAYQYKWDIDGDTKLEVETNEIRPAVRINMKNNSRLTWWEGYTNEAYITKNTTTSTLDFAVPTGYKHRWLVNGAEVMSLSDGTYGLRTAGDIFLPPNKWLYMDTSNNGISCSSTGNISYRAYSGTGNHLFFVGANEVCSVDINGLQMGVSSLPSNFPKIYTDYTQTNIVFGDGSNQFYTCSGTGVHAFRKGLGDIAYLDQLGLKLIVNNSALYLGTTGNFILQHDNGGTAGQFLIPSGWVYNFQIGGVGTAQIRSEGFYSFQNNTALQLGGTSPLRIKHDTASSQVQYIATGAYSHMFYINSTDLFYEMRQDTFRMLRGWQCKLGATGAYVSNNLNTSWNNPVGGLSCWIDTTRIGTFVISDYRIKENIVKARPVLERLCQVEMIEYELKDISIFKKMGRHHGFLAHQLEALFPELPNIVQGEKDAMTEDGKDIQPQTISAEATNLYLSAIQELNAKIEAQQKQIDGLLVAMAKLQSQ
jgi:hypothetical protein